MNQLYGVSRMMEELIDLVKNWLRKMTQVFSVGVIGWKETHNQLHKRR